MFIAIIIAVVITADTLRTKAILRYLKARLITKRVRIIAAVVALAFLWYVIENFFGPVAVAVVSTVLLSVLWERREEVRTYFKNLKAKLARPKHNAD